MADRYDQQVTVRQVADSLIRELRYISGSLAEVAAIRRGSGQFSPGFPERIQEAADELVTTVRSLASAGADRPVDLAASAVAHWSVLRREIISAHAVTSGNPGAGDAGSWAMTEGALGRAGRRLASLISLLGVTGFPVPGCPDAGTDGTPPAPRPARGESATRPGSRP